MGKSIGITAFVLLLISLPIPILGNYVSLLAVLILSAAAFQGEKQWVVIVDLLAWVKMFFLSPTWYFMMFGGGYMRSVNRDLERSGAMDSGTRSVMEGSTNSMGGLNSMTLLITLLILAAPIAVMVWRGRRAPAVGATDAEPLRASRGGGDARSNARTRGRSHRALSEHCREPWRRAPLVYWSAGRRRPPSA